MNELCSDYTSNFDYIWQNAIIIKNESVDNFRLFKQFWSFYKNK
jgi:hypothetical protein